MSFSINLMHCRSIHIVLLYFFYFFFNDTATTEIYTLSLHDALPIWGKLYDTKHPAIFIRLTGQPLVGATQYKQEVLRDRKSTRLNSSHSQISYAVFCLKKKKKKNHKISN